MGFIDSIKKKKFIIKGEILDKDTYKDIDLDDYIKTFYHLFVEIKPID